MGKKILYWVRNDQRLACNPVLSRAAALFETGAAETLLPVYVIDPEKWKTLSYGFKKTGAHPSRFLMESLADMREKLTKAGSGLHIAKGEPRKVLTRLAKEMRADIVVAQKEHTAEEVEQEQTTDKSLRESPALPGLKLDLVEGLSMIGIKSLPFPVSETPDVFTNFRKAVEKHGLKVKKPLPSPGRLPPFPRSVGQGLPADFAEVWPEDPIFLSLLEKGPSEKSVLPFKGGETAGRARLARYVESHLIATYKETRNGLLGGNYSTKFSPWLANGNLSAQEIYWTVRDYEGKHVKNKSTYWVIFEMLWRDFFRFQAIKHGRKYFFPGGIYDRPQRGNQDLEALEKWKKGQTGDDFVDANMTELSETGFMSNRGRQNAASFLVHDMGLDWRMGAAWFEHCLLDYDPCSNWGNWMYVAGVGHDPRSRKFNTALQAKKYDNAGRYRQHWLNRPLAQPMTQKNLLQND